MTKTIALISAIALAAGLSAAGAQAAPTHKHTGELASQSQLAREHARAVKAGDTANDPANSSSSDALNQQQLAKAQALPGADVQPGAINSGATNTSAADANTGMSTDSNMAPAPAPATNATPDQSNSMPPASPPVQGTTPDSQNTPQATPSTPQGGTTDANPSSPQ